MSRPAMTNSGGLAAAAIIHTAHDAADRLLADYARDLRSQGFRVRGVIKEDAFRGEACSRRMMIVDLDDNSHFLISQDLGPGSAGCCVDPGAIAAAGIALRRGLAEGADLVVANRFGVLEAGGEGFADEMLALMANGIPLLTVVADKYLDDWLRFTGNAATELPPQRDAVEAWFAGLKRKEGVAQ